MQRFFKEIFKPCQEIRHCTADESRKKHDTVGKLSSSRHSVKVGHTDKSSSAINMSRYTSKHRVPILFCYIGFFCCWLQQRLLEGHSPRSDSVAGNEAQLRAMLQEHVAWNKITCQRERGRRNGKLTEVVILVGLTQKVIAGYGICKLEKVGRIKSLKQRRRAVSILKMRMRTTKLILALSSNSNEMVMEKDTALYSNHNDFLFDCFAYHQSRC